MRRAPVPDTAWTVATCRKSRLGPCAIQWERTRFALTAALFLPNASSALCLLKTRLPAMPEYWLKRTINACHEPHARTHLLVEVLLDDRRLGLYVEEFVRQHGLWHAQTYSGWCFNCFMMIVLMKR